MPLPQTPQAAAREFSSHWIAQGFQPKALHAYEDNNGNILYWKIRLKHPDTGEKWIRPMHQNAKGFYILKEPEFPNLKPLYRLPTLLRHTEANVWVVEGEACVDKLEKRGLIATTSGGVDSVDVADWSALKKRNVIIWRDNDDAGIRYAEAVKQKLLSLQCNISCVDVDTLGLPPKADCVEWLQLHPTVTTKEIEALPLLSDTFKETAEHKKIVNDKNDADVHKDPIFFTDKTGVYHCDKDKKTWICSPLEIKARVRDKVSENWGRLLIFPDDDGKEHRWFMPMEMLKGGGEELRGELLRLGLDIAPNSPARNLLIKYITSKHATPRVCCVQRTGWHGDVFVLPERIFGETDEQLIYQTEVQVKDYKRVGTLDEWKKNISSLSVGNSRLVVAISSAFASMLLHLAGAESGGLHFVGESSTGKTTALRVAASVFGAPDYLHRWRATTNGLEALAALRSDTLLVLDELSQVEPREAGEIAYMLANGSGKARASKTGAARTRSEWRLLFLSAGEVSLGQHMGEAGRKVKAGQEVRLVDIPADAGKGFGLFETLHHFESGAALSQALLQATTYFYGTPAEAFLEHMTVPSNLKTLPDAIKKLMHQFIKENLPPHASGQAHRICERFALIAIAGELASIYSITGWEPTEARRSAITCFNAWLEARGGAGNQERAAILSQVQAFFEAHGMSRFEIMNGTGITNDQRVINRVGFRRTIPEGETEYFVLPEMFRQEICSGLDPKLAIRILLESGMLKPSSEGKAQSVQRLPGEGLKKCYHFIRTEPK